MVNPPAPLPSRALELIHQLFHGTYAPEGHPDNLKQVPPAPHPPVFVPLSAAGRIASTLAPFAPTPLRPIMATLTTPIGSPTPPGTNGFTVKRDPDDVGGLTIASTIYSAPTEISDGGAGFPGPAIPTPADVGVSAALPAPAIASEATTASTSAAPRVTVSKRALAIAAVVGLLLLA